MRLKTLLYIPFSGSLVLQVLPLNAVELSFLSFYSVYFHCSIILMQLFSYFLCYFYCNLGVFSSFLKIIIIIGTLFSVLSFEKSYSHIISLLRLLCKVLLFCVLFFSTCSVPGILLFTLRHRKCGKDRFCSRLCSVLWKQ